MNELEIPRKLRDFNRPRQPQVDLWPGIAARIERAEVTAIAPKRRAWLPLAAAATVVAALLTGAIVGNLQRGTDDADRVTTSMPFAIPGAHSLADAPGGDPRLLGAALELDSAHDELQQALEQRPDAVFLVSLLNRTNARRMKLDHFGASAG